MCSALQSVHHALHRGSDSSTRGKESLKRKPSSATSNYDALFSALCHDHTHTAHYSSRCVFSFSSPTRTMLHKHSLDKNRRDKTLRDVELRQQKPNFNSAPIFERKKKSFLINFVFRKNKERPFLPRQLVFHLSLRKK